MQKLETVAAVLASLPVKVSERRFRSAADLGLDLSGAIIEKNRFNRERADHKLENRAAGGKKY